MNLALVLIGVVSLMFGVLGLLERDPLGGVLLIAAVIALGLSAVAQAIDRLTATYRDALTGRTTAHDWPGTGGFPVVPARPVEPPAAGPSRPPDEPPGARPPPSAPADDRGT